MKPHHRFLALLSLGCLCLCGAAFGQVYSESVTQESWCDLDPSPCCTNCADSPSFTLSLTGVPTHPSGDATLTLEFLGDLDDPSDENLAVSLEGLQLGYISNEAPGDDFFSHPTDEVSDCIPEIMSAIIPAAALDEIVADGRIDVRFRPGQENNDIEAEGCLDPRESMTVTMQYEYVQVGVPTSGATFLLLTFGVLALMSRYLLKTRLNA